MNTTPQQTNNNQTATFPRTPTAHKKANRKAKNKQLLSVGGMVYSNSKDTVYRIELVLLDVRKYAVSRVTGQTTFACCGLDFDDCSAFAEVFMWYADSTFFERSNIIMKELVRLGWVCSNDGMSAISKHGHVAKLEKSGARYLEIFSNNRIVYDVDMRGFHPYNVALKLDKLQDNILTFGRFE